MYALGLTSVISSLFPVYPVGASLSRSSLCELAGAKTQLNAIFTSVLLFFVILFIGPLLEPLPMARTFHKINRLNLGNTCLHRYD